MAFGCGGSGVEPDDEWNGPTSTIIIEGQADVGGTVIDANGDIADCTMDSASNIAIGTTTVVGSDETETVQSAKNLVTSDQDAMTPNTPAATVTTTQCGI